MGKDVTIGGERVGSGNKMNTYLHGYGRSTHNLGRIFRSTMAPGTLVPFFVEIGLNGDTFDIDLETLVRTAPTSGPIFGSFKLQMDVYSVPMRLYNADLHMNMLNVGLNMNKITIPTMNVGGKNPYQDTVRRGRFNQSSLMAYLGFRGMSKQNTSDTEIFEKRNAIPMLAYWDIYKQYYSNKSEKYAYTIAPKILGKNIVSSLIYNRNTFRTVNVSTGVPSNIETYKNWYSVIFSSTAGGEISNDGIIFDAGVNRGDGYVITAQFNLNHLANNPSDAKAWGMKVVKTPTGYELFNTNNNTSTRETSIRIDKIYQQAIISVAENEVAIKSFELSNIDEMKKLILRHNSEEGTFNVSSIEPYATCVGITTDVEGNNWVNNLSSQNGLGLKTYQSDLFNNWINTEWIDGSNGITEITSVDVSDGLLKLDALNLAKKVYDLLNRVAVSGGTYQDWQEAVYGVDVARMAESPIYCGGLSREIVFEEVVSTVDYESDNTGQQPLGTLAGKGSQGKKKGGNVIIKVKEPSIIMGLVSITPRIDYSQGNKWFTRLRTFDDLHKPQLDGIGFQELITEQMASWESTYNFETEDWQDRSAGKQPAWLNYMTAYNENYGQFAEENELMFMTLNRRYEWDDSINGIKDLTTYIDPTKYNYAFAVSSLDAQNFWVQIATDMTVRRLISAKIIPNL